jgi:hypothetical protein
MAELGKKRYLEGLERTPIGMLTAVICFII